MLQIIVFGVVAIVCGGLWRYVRQRDVVVTAPMVSATLPWFGVVGALCGIQEAIALPPILDAIARSPTAYLVVASAVLALWLLTPKRVAGTEDG
jgi:uncharacterized membrane protein